MEDTLRVNNMNKESKIKAVLILVVMEDTLRVIGLYKFIKLMKS